MTATSSYFFADHSNYVFSYFTRSTWRLKDQIEFGALQIGELIANRQNIHVTH